MIASFTKDGKTASIRLPASGRKFATALAYDDKKFLCAFYYRQIGKNDRALNYLNDLLSRRPEMSKAKREKVLVLKNLQQYKEALGLAKENYYLYSDNPYHIQAYFDCLINTYQLKQEDQLLEELLERMRVIKSEKAQSMYISSVRT